MEWSITSVILKKLDVDISAFQRFKATPIREEDIKKAHLVFAMDSLVLEKSDISLVKQFPKYVGKIKLFSSIAEKKTDVVDCGGSDDYKLHCQSNETIVKTLDAGFKTLIKMC